MSCEHKVTIKTRQDKVYNVGMYNKAKTETNPGCSVDVKLRYTCVECEEKVFVSVKFTILRARKPTPLGVG
jgi:DNA-directed RNA polymerase subunit RPC12/RpoP